jgi:hypothetical protein
MTRHGGRQCLSWLSSVITQGGSMPTYLVTYHGGGGPPPSAEAREQMMAAFGAWVASVGDHMVDPGAPLGAAKTVSPEGVSDHGTEATIGGYSLIRADDLDTAVVLVKNHPFVARGGSLQVSEAVAP